MNFENLPEGWVMVKLDNISHLITKGTTPTSVGFKFTDVGILFVKVESLSNQRIIHNLCTFIDTQANNALSRSQLQENDILFSIAGTLGKVAVVTLDDLPANTNQALAIIRIIQPISTQYIAHLLGSNFLAKVIRKEGRGTTLNNLNLKQISQFEIPLPPLNEQIRIVAKIEALQEKINEAKAQLQRVQILLKKFRRIILRKAFKGQLTEKWRAENPNIESAELLLEKIKFERRKKWEDSELEKMKAKGITPKDDKWKDKYKEPEIDKIPAWNQRILYDLPEGWLWVNLGTIEIFIGSGITPKGGQEVYVKSGIPFIRCQNVYPDGLHLDDIVYISEEIHQKMNRTHVKPKDVLLNITGIARSTFIPENIKDANVNQHVCIIRTIPLILSEYTSNFLNSFYGQKQILNFQHGITRPGVNYQQVRSIYIPIPPLAEQEEIVKKVEKIFEFADIVEEKVTESLKNLERLNRKILGKAFRGELVPQDPNDEPASILLERIKAEKLEEKPKKLRKSKK